MDRVGLLRGSYVLLLRNNGTRRIRVGRLGVLLFSRGFYAYFGSMFGPGGLEARVKRHLGRRKKKHWHIDYILDHMRVSTVYVLLGKDLESRLSRMAVMRYCYVKGFGCSDKRGDRSHLIYLKNSREAGEFKKFLISVGFRKYRPGVFVSRKPVVNWRIVLQPTPDR